MSHFLEITNNMTAEPEDLTPLISKLATGHDP